MTIRENAVRHALTFVGTVEHPPHSNRGPMIDKWNKGAGAPAGSFWCASFIHGMFGLAKFFLPGGASVQEIRQTARREGWIVKRPRRGDLACYDFHEGDKYGAFGDHIGDIVRVLALRWRNGTFTGWIKTVEGNTTSQADLLSGWQANGGGVYVRTRWLRGISAEFIRVPG